MKKFRKLLCLAMAAVTALSMSVTASADIENDSGVFLTETITNVEPDDEELVLASSEEIVLDDGYTVEVNTFLEDGIETFASDTGHKYYKCEASFTNSVDQVVIKLWVKGTFYWDSSNNRAYVTGGDGGYTIVNPSFKYVSKEYKTGDDAGGYWGGKRYSYVEQSLTFKNNTNKQSTYTLTFDVNVEGEYHYNTHWTAAGSVVVTS